MVFSVPSSSHCHCHGRNLHTVKPIPIPVLFPKTHSHSHFRPITYDPKQLKPDNVNVNRCIYTFCISMINEFTSAMQAGVQNNSAMQCNAMNRLSWKHATGLYFRRILKIRIGLHEQ